MSPRYSKGFKENLEDRLDRYKLVSALDFYNGTPCVYWTGRHSVKGYPVIQIDKKPVKVSRLMASIHYGLNLTDPTQHALHHCDRPGCWNQEHLFVGAAADNTHDSVNKGRHRPLGISTKRKAWKS